MSKQCTLITSLKRILWIWGLGCFFLLIRISTFNLVMMLGTVEVLDKSRISRSLAWRDTSILRFEHPGSRSSFYPRRKDLCFFYQVAKHLANIRGSILLKLPPITREIITLIECGIYRHRFGCIIYLRLESRLVGFVESHNSIQLS